MEGRYGKYDDADADDPDCDDIATMSPPRIEPQDNSKKKSRYL